MHWLLRLFGLVVAVVVVQMALAERQVNLFTGGKKTGFFFILTTTPSSQEPGRQLRRMVGFLT